MSVLEKLMKKYRSISLIDIAREFDKYHYPPTHLDEIKENLIGYKYHFYDESGFNDQDDYITYKGISAAQTIEEIHEAFKDRANYLEKDYLKRFKAGFNYGDEFELVHEEINSSRRLILVKQYCDPIMINFVSKDNELFSDHPHRLEMKRQKYPSKEDLAELLKGFSFSELKFVAKENLLLTIIEGDK